MIKQLRSFFLLLFVYLVIALPFRAMTLIPGFSDVRPVAALAPIYGVFFGPIGCAVCAFGNLIADAVGHALRWSSFAGFSANFFAPFMIWFLWKRFGRHPFALRTIPDILFHTLVIVAVTILDAAILTPAVAYAYPDVDAKYFAYTVLLNNISFRLVFGIPAAIVMQEKLGFKPYSN